MIKPRGNSFLYELATNPAVFLYLDPGITKEEFENAIAHELHHVGARIIQRLKDVSLSIPPATPTA